jgi:hypothetical protein
MKVRVPLEPGNYLTSRMAIRVLTKTLPYKVSLLMGGFNDKILSRYFSRGTKENNENLSQDNWCLCRGSNKTLFLNKSTMLLLDHPIRRAVNI